MGNLPASIVGTADLFINKIADTSVIHIPNTMDIKQLESFVHVATQGSLTRAALTLEVSQPTLSRHLRQLEQHLACHLFLRNGRGVELTEAGRTLLTYGQHILALKQQAELSIAALSTHPTGRVSLGLPPRLASTLTTPLVQRFRSRFPDAAIAVSESLSAPLREDLLLGKLHVALLFDPPPPPKLDYHTLYRENMVLYGIPTRSHPLNRPVALKQLAHYPILAPRKPHAVRQLIESHCMPRSIALNIVAEVDTVHMLIKLAQSGEGFALLPETSIPDLGQTPYRYAPLTRPAIQNRLVLAASRQTSNSRLTQALVQLLRDQDYQEWLRAAEDAR